MSNKTALDISGGDFRWHVCKAGYLLEERTRSYNIDAAFASGVAPFTERRGLAFVHEVPNPLDTCHTIDDFSKWSRVHFREYEPEDGLHMTFADVPHRPEDARQFVNQFGTLSGGVWPDFVDDFFACRDMIRKIVRLAHTSRDTANMVQEIVNNNREHFLLRMRPGNKRNLFVQLAPQSLFGYMLLAAVREWTGSTWRHCSECGVRFEIRADGRVAKRKFCGDSCRVAAHRKGH